MSLRTFQVGTPRRRGEGLRIGAVRYPPRGVSKPDYARLDYFDVWFPLLAPSRKLLGSLRGTERTPATVRRFFDRYEREILSNTDSKQALLLLAAIAERMPVSVGCYCEDESVCHRSVLLELLRRAMQGEVE